MNKDRIENLLSYADELDVLGLHKEADQIGWVANRVLIHSKVGFNKNASLNEVLDESDAPSEDDSINQILQMINLLSQDGRDTVLAHIIAMDEQSLGEE